MGRNDDQARDSGFIENRIEKAQFEHHEKWLDRNEYISVKAELMAISITSAKWRAKYEAQDATPELNLDRMVRSARRVGWRAYCSLIVDYLWQTPRWLSMTLVDIDSFWNAARSDLTVPELLHQAKGVCMMLTTEFENPNGCTAVIWGQPANGRGR